MRPDRTMSGQDGGMNCSESKASKNIASQFFKLQNFKFNCVGDDDCFMHVLSEVIISSLKRH